MNWPSIVGIANRQIGLSKELIPADSFAREMVQTTAADEFAIRPACPGDAQALNAIVTHPQVARTLLQLPSKELAQTDALLQESKPGLHRFVAEKNGSIAGAATLTQPQGVFRFSAVAQHENGSSKVVGNLTLQQPQNPRLVHSARFGMGVHPRYWGLGIGTQLVEAALDLADNWLGLRRVELEVHADNPAAIHLYQKCGFVLEGTKQLYSFGAGRWADAHFMARLSNAGAATNKMLD